MYPKNASDYASAISAGNTHYAEATQPKETPEVPQQCGRLGSAIENLRDAHARLRSRLQSAVRPMPPHPVAADNKISGAPLSPLGEALRQGSISLEQMAADMNDLTDSLAL